MLHTRSARTLLAAGLYKPAGPSFRWAQVSASKAQYQVEKLLWQVPHGLGGGHACVVGLGALDSPPADLRPHNLQTCARGATSPRLAGVMHNSPRPAWSASPPG